MELQVAAIKYLLEDLKLSSLDYFQGRLWLMGCDLQQKRTVSSLPFD